MHGTTVAGGMNEWERTLRLQTTLAPADVLDHYAAQFREAGWTTSPPASDGGTAALTAGVRDARGATWRALVAVTALSPTERELVIHLLRHDPAGADPDRRRGRRRGARPGG